MRKDSIILEEKRLQEVIDLSDYQQVHERHRIFPAVFEDRKHEMVMDISAGVGLVASRIKKDYPCDLYVNETSEKCLNILTKNKLKTFNFDLDNKEASYPFADRTFDAIISLATIEHLMNTDHYLSEIRRILKDDGCFYVSAPNYSGLTYLIPFLLTGRTFHNPRNPNERYEFFAHIRYFTYRTMLEYFSEFGYKAEAVYIGKPEGSTKFNRLKDRSKFKAYLFKYILTTFYTLFNPRWAAEPVICFRKVGIGDYTLKPRKIIL